MQVQQVVLPRRGRQDLPLDTAHGADEADIQCRLLRDEGVGHGKTRIQMATGTPARDVERAGPSHLKLPRPSSGSGSASLYTRSRVLPMFTRMPVMSNEMSRLLRP